MAGFVEQKLDLVEDVALDVVLAALSQFLAKAAVEEIRAEALDRRDLNAHAELARPPTAVERRGRISDTVLVHDLLPPIAGRIGIGDIVVDHIQRLLVRAKRRAGDVDPGK